MRELDHALLIRQIEATDAEAAARLSGELGYPVTADAMKARIDNLGHRDDHVVYVACVANVVVGWIHVSITQHLQSEMYGEIGGFVVSNAHRSCGIGAKLLARAEQWIADRSIAHVVVRSRMAREAAHRFYVREGYSQIKTSAVFSKQLG